MGGMASGEYKGLARGVEEHPDVLYVPHGDKGIGPYGLPGPLPPEAGGLGVAEEDGRGGGLRLAENGHGELAFGGHRYRDGPRGFLRVPADIIGEVVGNAYL